MILKIDLGQSGDGRTVAALNASYQLNLKPVHLGTRPGIGHTIALALPVKPRIGATTLSDSADQVDVAQGQDLLLIGTSPTRGFGCLLKSLHRLAVTVGMSLRIRL